ncbi:hypothetical protein YDYSY3_24260 [Paenibacillus chitinolyticus]|uniref:hypothetical protein n=1 Tax=Paenibacillus chitinolyticus TaxID=79263 RepID=UPI0026E4CB49|nr:hypothetical protein [Paenibacillus chitinolyticus]GKS11426.1 hypothetical protein YDYSY3_24260 [Paenibacillus chitinolyticus]
MSAESFSAHGKISGDLLQERLETVKDLKQSELDMYALSKDKETGEHYVHYAYKHRQISGTGEEEQFHQLLPVESDDVLGILFSDQPYEYPDAWNRPFLRNGPEGFYIWFDPAYAEDTDADEDFAREVRERLLKMKQTGKVDEEAVRKLFRELDDLK